MYYIAPDGTLMATTITERPGTLVPGPPIRLFPTRIVDNGTSMGGGMMWQYDVGADGRFLINVNMDEAGTPPITVIEHWTPKAP